MTAQGRAATHSARPWLCDVAYTSCALAVVLILASCAGSRSSADTFQFGDDSPLEILRVLDRTTIHLSGDVLPDVASDLSRLTPVSICIRPSGILISDLESGRILQLTQDLTVVAGSSGAASGAIGARRAARFIRTDLAGRIYASDGVNDRVTVYDAGLRAVTELEPPYRALELPNGQVTGIATGAYGELYLADQSNGVVYHLDANGAFVSQFSGEGVAWAQLRRPMGLACDNRDGSVYVCDPGERRVVVFDNTGTPLRAFGETDLREPVAIALDERGQIYVADPVAKAVVVFDHNGHYLGRIDDIRLQTGSIGTPSDVAVDRSSLLVADPSQGRVLWILLGRRPGVAPTE